MKKVFLLGLLLCSVVSMNAQVRIGGDTIPHAAAVLDLNANNDSLPAGNKGGLALPRVSLASNTAQLNGAVPANGMMVYNTGGALEAGIYYWNGTLWMKETENSVANILAPLITWVPMFFDAAPTSGFGRPSASLPLPMSINMSDTCAPAYGLADVIIWAPSGPGNAITTATKCILRPVATGYDAIYGKPGAYYCEFDGRVYIYVADNSGLIHLGGPLGPAFFPMICWRHNSWIDRSVGPPYKMIY